MSSPVQKSNFNVSRAASLSSEKLDLSLSNCFVWVGSSGYVLVAPGLRDTKMLYLPVHPSCQLLPASQEDHPEPPHDCTSRFDLCGGIIKTGWVVILI